MTSPVGVPLKLADSCGGTVHQQKAFTREDVVSAGGSHEKNTFVLLWGETRGKADRFHRRPQACPDTTVSAFNLQVLSTHREPPNPWK